MDQQEKTLTININLATQEFEKKMDASVSKLKMTEDELKDLKGLLDSFSSTFTTFGTEAVKYANELEGALGKVKNTFGESSGIVKNFAQNSLNSFGIAETSALEMISSFSDVSSVMGLSQGEAANMGAGLTALAADLASYKNVQVDVAGSALKGIFTGDADALQELGIAMNDAALEQFRMKEGFKETYAHMDEAEKAALRYGFVMNATAAAQGDFAKNSDGTASQMQIFNESIKELYASFGEVLLPILNQGLIILNDVIQFFKDLDPGVKKAILVVGGLAASIGPLMVGFEKLSLVFKLASNAVTSFGSILAKVFQSLMSGIMTLMPHLATLSLPVIAIGAAVVVAAGVIIYNWDKISKFLHDTGIWDTVIKGAKYALGFIIEIVKAFGNLLEGNWSGLWGNIKNIVGSIWNNIIDIITGGIKGVMKLQIKLYDFLGMEGLSKGAKTGLSMIDTFANGFKVKTADLVKNGESFAKKIANIDLSFDFGGKPKKIISGKNYGIDYKTKINDNPDKPKEEPKTTATKYTPKPLTKALADIGPLQSKNSLLGMVLGDQDESALLQERVEDLKSTFSDVFGGNKEAFISIMSDAMNGYDFGADLQKKFDSIQIKMTPPVLSNADEINLAISNTFDQIREKFGEQSDTTFSLLGTQIRQSIENGMKPEEAGQSIFESFQKIVEKIKEVFGENANMTDFSAYGEQILQSMVSGLDVTKASDDVLGQIDKMNKAIMNAINDSLKAAVDAVGDVISGIFEQAVGGKKLNVKAIAGGLLSTLGGIAMDLGKTALSIGLGIEAIKTSLKSLSGAGAIAAGIGLLALGGILKGVGGKLAGSGSMGSTGSVNASPTSPGFSYANAPSYALQKQSSQQTTTESVLRGGDVFWSGQRYEVIRGF
jgi:prophage DNA circulation protein